MRTLYATDTRLIGRWELTSVAGLPFFNTGIMAVWTQSVGNTTWSQMDWHIRCNCGAIASLPNRRISAFKPLTPAALPVLSFDMACSISSREGASLGTCRRQWAAFRGSARPFITSLELASIGGRAAAKILRKWVCRSAADTTGLECREVFPVSVRSRRILCTSLISFMWEAAVA